MGRTIHYNGYRSKPLTKSEKVKIIRFKNAVNSKHSFEHEQFNPEVNLSSLMRSGNKVVWGFTKTYDNDKDVLVVIKALKRLKKMIPSIGWEVYDEGRYGNVKI